MDIPPDLINAGVSGGLGFLMRAFTEGRKMVHSERMTAAHNNGNGGGGGKEITPAPGIQDNKITPFLRASLVLSITLAFIFIPAYFAWRDMPMIYEYMVENQGLSRWFNGPMMITKFQEIRGYLLTNNLQSAFVTVVSVYVGQSLAK